MAKDSDTTLSPEVCRLIVAGLAPDERVASVSDDGSFVTLTPDGILHERALPPKLQATLLLNSLTKTIEESEQFSQRFPRGFTAALLPGGQDYWLKIRDAYCSFHPGEAYSGLDAKERFCGRGDSTGIPQKFATDLLTGASVLRLNLQTARIDDEGRKN